MKQSKATRRLVKSPPELWAELSSEDSLSRHLSGFGDIRITRVKPETTVAWEGDRASGTVELTPTGWGTKVVLSATPAEAAAQAASAPMVQAAAAQQAQAASAPPAPADPAPERIEPGHERVAPSPVPEKRRGFFARLFRRRPAPVSSIPGPPAPTPDPSPPTPTPEPGPIPQPAPAPAPPTPTPAPPPPPQIQALDCERTEAILVEVLDDLGAAHHRPFSRD